MADTNFMTEDKVTQLTDKGYVTEGYLMRDEIGNYAIVHNGRVVWLTSDEMDTILSPNANIDNDEEEG